MMAHIGVVGGEVMIKIEEMQECIMEVMSISTSVAQILKNLRNLAIQALRTSGSSSKPHSSTRNSVIAEEQPSRHQSRSRNSSLTSTPSEPEGSRSLRRGSISSPSPSPRIPPGSARKTSQAVTFKPVEKKPSIFEQLVSLLQSENRQNELEIIHYFSKLLGDALLSAVTSSLTMFKTSVTPRYSKSVSTHNSSDTGSNSTTLLEFTTNVTFVIPESRLIPDLKRIQSTVDRVCSSVMSILQSVVWWGGSHSGTPLYNELIEDMKLKELLEFLSSCILGQCVCVCVRVYVRVRACVCNVCVCVFMWHVCTCICECT